MRGMFAVMAVAGMLVLGSCKKSVSNSPAQYQIAVIPKGTTHVHWKSVHAGADRAAKELGVSVIWKGPLQENDRAQQISIVEQFVSQGISAIVLAPLDDSALVKPVREADERKIPVILFDSGLKAEAGKDYVSYVATDNEKGGEIAGKELVRILGGKGKVVLLRYEEGSASTMEREKGFMDIMKQNPGIQMISDNRYAGATVDSAQNASMNMLDQVKQADAIFCPNESSTMGMLLALRQAGLAGKIKFVGFDASPKLVEALKANEVQALVAQNPFKMGYEGVKEAVAVLRGQSVPRYVDTGVELVTPENVNSPEIQKLLNPQ